MDLRKIVQELTSFADGTSCRYDLIMILPIFGVEPPLKATTGRIRVIWGAGGQPIAWEGSLSLGESGITQEMAKNKSLLKWVRTRCPENMKEETSFQLNGAIEFYSDNGALIQKENCSFFVSFDVAEKPQSQPSQHDLHMQALEVIKEVKSATVAAIKDISAASAQALNAVAIPLSDVSKALVKMAEDARHSSAESAKESQNMLVQALTNRIIEGNQVQARSKNSLAEEIESIARLLPMFQSLLGNLGQPSHSAAPSDVPALPGAEGKPKS